MSHVLLTGANGFVASHILAILIDVSISVSLLNPSYINRRVSVSDLKIARIRYNCDCAVPF